MVVIHNHVNLGIVDSLNFGIEAAKGEYIARMDADDISHPSRLEHQLEFLINNNYDVVGAKAITFGRWYSKKKFPVAMNSSEVRLAMLFMNPVVHPLVMAKASVFKENKYLKHFQWAEDYELWVRLIKKGYKFGVQDEVLLGYRIHPGQVSSKRRAVQNKITKKIQANYHEFFLGSKLNVLASNNLSQNLITLNRAYERSQNDVLISKQFIRAMLYEIGVKKVRSFSDYKLLKDAYLHFELSISFTTMLLLLLLIVDNSFFGSRLRSRFSNAS